MTSAGPPPFTLRQLQYAVAVAEHGSFRRAAEACRVAQPSLSAQLQELEDALGVRLFERDRRAVRTTRAGEWLLPRARALLADVGGLVDEARRLADPLAGPLRLGVIPTIGPYLLPDVAPLLRAALPRVTLAWSEDRTRILVDALRAGELDGALVALEASLGEVQSLVLGRDEFLLAVPAGHPRAAGEGPVGLDALDDAELLLLEEGHCLRDQVLAVCGRRRTQRTDVRTTSLGTLAQMVAGGGGVTLIPWLAAPVENRAGGLVLRAFADPAPARTLALVFRPGAPSLDALRIVAQVIRGHLEARAGAPLSPSRRRR
jgi:LysR family hydrogen peroxide-inducible transcriptional activator